MEILYKDQPIQVVNTFEKVKVCRVGVRGVYKEVEGGQKYIKCFGKWWKFPQEVEY